MENKELYYKVFSTLSPEVDPDLLASKIRSTEITRTSIPRRLILIAAVISAFSLIVVAAGIHYHWLSPFLSNSDSNPQIELQTQNVNEFGQLNGITYGFGRVLSEGSIVYMEISMETEKEQPLPELCNDTALFIKLLREDGSLENLNFCGTWHRIDDGSKTGYAQYTYCAQIQDMGAECLAGKTLHIGLWAPEWDKKTIYGTPMAEFISTNVEVQLGEVRHEKICESIGVRLTSLGVDIQGYEFFGQGKLREPMLLEIPCGVILNNGSRVPLTGVSIMYYEDVKSEDYWNSGRLTQMIDVNDAIGIYLGETDHLFQETT